MDCDRFVHFLEVDHGISPKVWKNRYSDHESVERTRSFFPEGELAPNQATDLSKLVNWLEGKSGERGNPDPGGIIIHRFALPGWDKLVPEIRPWVPMAGRVRDHYHGDSPTGALVNPANGKVLTDLQIFTEVEAHKHIDSKKSDWGTKGSRHGGDGTEGSGTNRQDVHRHVDEQKYRFLAGPIVREWRSHSHRAMFEAGLRKLETGVPEELAFQKLANHLRKKHGGTELEPWDEHKHQWPVKTWRSRTAADRLDFHPLALPLFKRAERVFFCIEGCIKADAILSAILDTREASAVFSVPSVTMWNEDELLRAAPLLYGKTVIIVPDGDWFLNSLVETQAKLIRSFLRRRLNIKAHIAATDIGLVGEDIKAFDDLRARNPDANLDDLHVIDWETAPELADFVSRPRGWRGDRFLRAADAFEGLALHAASNGALGSSLQKPELGASMQKLSRAMGVNYDRVRDGVEDLRELGVVEVDGSLETVEKVWRGNRPVYGLDWELAPKITLAEGVPRPRRLDPIRLSDFDLNQEITGSFNPYPSADLRREVKEVWDDAILGDIAAGYTVKQAAERYKRHPEAIRRLDGVSQAELVLGWLKESQVFALRARGKTPAEIVELFRWRANIKPAVRTVRRITSQGKVAEKYAVLATLKRPPEEWEDRDIDSVFKILFTAANGDAPQKW
jgi:hypothetical protein